MHYLAEYQVMKVMITLSWKAKTKASKLPKRSCKKFPLTHIKTIYRKINKMDFNGFLMHKKKARLVLRSQETS